MPASGADLHTVHICPYAGPVTDALTRREANKVRTRAAVVRALRGLVERLPLEEITVDQVAVEAGVSRRTFFNYYAGIPAVLVEVFSGYAETMVAGVDPDLLRQDPLEALRLLVASGGVDGDFLGWMAAVNGHGTPGEGALVIERTVWAELGEWLDTRLRDLFPAGTEPLYLTTLAASVMHAFAAAEQEWLADLATPTRLTDVDLVAFAEHLQRALGHLARGWRPDGARST